MIGALRGGTDPVTSNMQVTTMTAPVARLDLKPIPSPPPMAREEQAQRVVGLYGIREKRARAHLQGILHGTERLVRKLRPIAQRLDEDALVSASAPALVGEPEHNNDKSSGNQVVKAECKAKAKATRKAKAAARRHAQAAHGSPSRTICGHGSCNMCGSCNMERVSRCRFCGTVPSRRGAKSEAETALHLAGDASGGHKHSNAGEDNRHSSHTELRAALEFALAGPPGTEAQRLTESGVIPDVLRTVREQGAADAMRAARERALAELQARAAAETSRKARGRWKMGIGKVKDQLQEQNQGAAMARLSSATRGNIEALQIELADVLRRIDKQEMAQLRLEVAAAKAARLREQEHNTQCSIISAECVARIAAADAMTAAAAAEAAANSASLQKLERTVTALRTMNSRRKEEHSRNVGADAGAGAGAGAAVDRKSRARALAQILGGPHAVPSGETGPGRRMSLMRERIMALQGELQRWRIEHDAASGCDGDSQSARVAQRAFDVVVGGGDGDCGNVGHHHAHSRRRTDAATQTDCDAAHGTASAGVGNGHGKEAAPGVGNGTSAAGTTDGSGGAGACGTALSQLKGMKKPGKVLPLINTCVLIGNIYDAKVQAEAVDRRLDNEPQELPRFCEQYLLQRYGLKSVATKHLRNLIASIKAHAKGNRRCWQFAMLAGIDVPGLDEGHKLPQYFSQAASFFFSLLAHMYGEEGKNVEGGDVPVPSNGAIANRLKEVKDVYMDKAKVVEAARAMFRPVVFDLLLPHFDTNAAVCPKHPKTHAEQVEVDHILRMCMDAWPREVGEEVHESEMKAARSVQRVFRLAQVAKQTMRLLRAARQRRQVAELDRVFAESGVLGADASRVFEKWASATHRIDPTLDTARCAELLDLALELAAAKEGIDYDADEDDDREPTLSADIFVEAMQAYGYRFNVFNKWVRDHHVHTEYEVTGSAGAFKIVEKDTQVQWANQRRASLCNVAPVIHDD